MVFDQNASSLFLEGNVLASFCNFNIQASNMKLSRNTIAVERGIGWNETVILAAERLRTTETNREKIVANGVFYTACPMCTGPFWSLRAQTVRYEQDTVRLTHPRFYIRKTLVARFPFLSLPLKPRSGFLFPHAGWVSDMGAFASLPYYKIIGDRHDLLLKPTFSTQKGLILEGHTRFSNHTTLRGDVQGSFNPHRVFENPDLLDGPFQGHFVGRLEWNVHPRWRLKGEEVWTTSRDYFRMRPIFGDMRQAFLTSSWTVEGFFAQGYAAVRTLRFKSLRHEKQLLEPPTVFLAETFQTVSTNFGYGSFFGDLKASVGQKEVKKRARVDMNWSVPHVDGYGGLHSATVGNAFLVKNTRASWSPYMRYSFDWPLAFGRRWTGGPSFKMHVQPWELAKKKSETWAPLQNNTAAGSRMDVGWNARRGTFEGFAGVVRTQSRTNTAVRLAWGDGPVQLAGEVQMQGFSKALSYARVQGAVQHFRLTFLEDRRQREDPRTLRQACAELRVPLTRTTTLHFGTLFDFHAKHQDLEHRVGVEYKNPCFRIFASCAIDRTRHPTLKRGVALTISVQLRSFESAKVEWPK